MAIRNKINRTSSLWGLMFLAFISHLLISSYDNPGFWTDSFIYLLQADYFQNKMGSDFYYLESAMSYRSFPPLYPYYLSIFAKGSEHIVLASIVTSMLLLPFCFLYIKWQVNEGLPENYALINAILFLLLPSTLLLSTEIWSENLYLFFVSLSLWSFSKSKDSSCKWQYISAFVCGLAIVTRTAGLSLAVALFIVLCKRGNKNIISTIIIMLMPLLVWKLVSSGIHYNQTYLEHGLLMRYESFLNAYGGFWSGNATIVQFQLKTLWLGLQLQFNNIVSDGTAILSIVVIVMTSITIYKRAAHLSLDALYVLLYCGIIFAWNFSEHNVRFLYVLMPFILFYAQTAVLDIFKKGQFPLSKIAKGVIPLLIMITVLPCLIFMAGRLYSIPENNLRDLSNDRQWLTGLNKNKMYKHIVFKNRLKESVVKIKEIIPPGECVFSIHQEFVMLYSKRTTILPPKHDISQAKFNEEMKQCRYVFIVGVEYRKHESLYPVDRIKNNSWIIQQSFYPDEYGGEIISVLLELEREKGETFK